MKTDVREDTLLPACLSNPGDLPFESHLPETYPANPEIPQVPPGPATTLATVVFSDLKFLFSLTLKYETFFCQSPSLMSLKHLLHSKFFRPKEEMVGGKAVPVNRGGGKPHRLSWLM